MRCLVLAALVVAVTADWQPGKLYKYDVVSHTHASLQKGAISGAALQAQLLVKAKAGGRLQLKLQNPQHAQLHDRVLQHNELPENLSYEPVKGLDAPFEVLYTEGRIQALKIPSSLSVSHENLLKGLIGNLQVDLSPQRLWKSSHEHYDREAQQGQFRKMEADVTGDCETLYTVAPLSAEWRRELPELTKPRGKVVEISKSKNYRNCAHRVSYHFGVPEGADWTGAAKKPEEEEFVKRTTTTRMIAGKDGIIYKSETKSSVYVSPLMYGQQKAEVISKVVLILKSVDQDSESEWQMEESVRNVKSLLYSLSHNSVSIDDSSSSSSSSESVEKKEKIVGKLNRVRRTLDEKELIQFGDSGEIFSNPNNNYNQGNQPPTPENNNYKQVNQPPSPKENILLGNQKNNNKQRKYSGSDSSSSSSSASNDLNDEVPKFNEPAYAALYMHPFTRNEKKNYQAVTQKLLQEIAQQIQNPNNMPKSDTLSKITILIRNIASMTYEQLTQVSRSIEVGQDSSNKIKCDMWMVYRDCVAQAGTLPAFQQIKAWIINKKLQGKEAAQVVASLPNTLRYPTKEVIVQFFQLAMSQEVKDQQYLNTTALLSATKFINIGHVDNDTVHTRFPTHMYGRLVSNKDQFVSTEILPALNQELKNAIQNGDSRKVQVYIKAIGNVGHHDILMVFAPYLEGKVPVSTYLRALMVENLGVLARQRDHHARAVLFSILKNTAEPYEVRVAAILNIFKAEPSQAMMYAMAQATHDDPSIHVRAALKTVIETAAELENPCFMSLAKAAREAKPMLTKERFGKQYSGKRYSDHWDEERFLGGLRVLSYIDSDDSLIPKYMNLMQQNKFGGWVTPRRISYSLSSVGILVDLIKQSMQNQQQSVSPQNKLKYTVEKITQMLNIKHGKRVPFEANFQFDIIDHQAFFAFSEDDIQELPKLIEQQIANLANGVDYHYTKILNQAQVSIMFPVAMGVPFIFKYKQPTLIHIVGKSQATVQRPSRNNEQFSANVQSEVEVTFARNLDGSVGFIDTLSESYAGAGVQNKFQLYLPIKAQVQVESGKVKVHLEPLRADQDTNLVHFSVWPYTFNQKKDSHTTMAQNPTSKIVVESSKVNQIDTKFGQQYTGMQFHLQGYSHSKDYTNVYRMFQGHDFISGLMFGLYQKDIAMTHYNFRYLGKQSQWKGFTLTAQYGKYHMDEQSPQNNVNVEALNNIEPATENRRQEILKEVSENIRFAEVKYIDLNATFDGADNTAYVLTAAMADSLVDPNIKYRLRLHRHNDKLGKLQLNAACQVVKPAMSSLNFLEALNRDIKLNFSSEFIVQNEDQILGQIQINGLKERSNEFVENLKNSYKGKICAEQMTQNNFYQAPCYEMILRAHALDQMKATILYKDLSPTTRNSFYQMYRMLRHLGFWYTEENVVKINQEGQIDVEANMNFFENTMNFYLFSRFGEFKFNNLPIPKFTGRMMSVYPIFNPLERVANYYSNYQYQPFCTIDNNKIFTFSNRQLDYELTNTWHVVMQASEWWQTYNRQAVILARKTGSKQQEVHISYRAANNEELNIDVTPSQEGSDKYGTVHVDTNAQKVSEGEVTVYRKNQGQNLLKYHALSDGTLYMNFEEGILRVIYDGQRLVILPNTFRNYTNGVCGSLSGDPRDDYYAPQGLIDNPELYGASYALIQEGGDQKTQQLYQQAQQQSYPQEYHCTSILRFDEQWKAAVGTSSSSSSSSEEDGTRVVLAKSYNTVSGNCELQQQVQFFYENGKLCMSTETVPSCTKECRGFNYKEQNVNVVCKPQRDQQFRMYKLQILGGMNPSITPVGNQQAIFRIPSGCKAY